MKPLRNRIWRNAIVVALLLFVQFSYAAQLCLSGLGSAVPAHAMNASPPEQTMRTAGIDDAAAACCVNTAPEPQSCIARDRHFGLVAFIATPSFDVPSPELAPQGLRNIGGRWRRPPTRLAASPSLPLPLHALFGRYLI